MVEEVGEGREEPRRPPLPTGALEFNPKRAGMNGAHCPPPLPRGPRADRRVGTGDERGVRLELFPHGFIAANLRADDGFVVADAIAGVSHDLLGKAGNVPGPSRRFTRVPLRQDGRGERDTVRAARVRGSGVNVGEAKRERHGDHNLSLSDITKSEEPSATRADLRSDHGTTSVGLEPFGERVGGRVGPIEPGGGRLGHSTTADHGKTGWGTSSLATSSIRTPGDRGKRAGARSRRGHGRSTTRGRTLTLRRRFARGRARRGGMK